MVGFLRRSGVVGVDREAKLLFLIRSLPSEGRVRYQTVESTHGGLQPRLIEREGPTGLIVTTTRDGLHPENETRLISLTLADTEEQTRAILKALADEDRRDEVDRAPWRALQDWISASDARVTIPFSDVLIDLIPPRHVRLRRDVKLVLNLIRAHALLHQASRKRDEAGRVIATLQDYAGIQELVAEYIAQGVQASVASSVRATVEAIRTIVQKRGFASVHEVARALNLDRSAASRRCQTAQRRGYIRNEESSQGRAARYILGDPLPSDQPIIPDPSRLAAALAERHPEGIPHSGTVLSGDNAPSQAQALEGAAQSRRRRFVL